MGFCNRRAYVIIVLYSVPQSEQRAEKHHGQWYINRGDSEQTRLYRCGWKKMQ